MNTKKSQIWMKIIKFQLFETCTTYLVQNGIPNSTKRGPKPHFVVQGGPIRAQPARPASLAASAGRWAWPAGGPRWQPMGQLAAISRCSSWQWIRAEVGREEAGQTTAPPPHSYHRRWVIWYGISYFQVHVPGGQPPPLVQLESNNTALLYIP